MEHIQNEHRSPSHQDMFSVTIWQLREAIARHLLNKGIGRTCNVVVGRKGKVLELLGNVDSEWTHFEILAMVPDEERCVVDKIQVLPYPV